MRRTASGCRTKIRRPAKRSREFADRSVSTKRTDAMRRPLASAQRRTRCHVFHIRVCSERMHADLTEGQMYLKIYISTNFSDKFNSFPFFRRESAHPEISRTVALRTAPPARPVLDADDGAVPTNAARQPHGHPDSGKTRIFVRERSADPLSDRPIRKDAEKDRRGFPSARGRTETKESGMFRCGRSRTPRKAGRSRRRYAGGTCPASRNRDLNSGPLHYE